MKQLFKYHYSDKNVKVATYLWDVASPRNIYFFQIGHNIFQRGIIKFKSLKIWIRISLLYANKKNSEELSI